MSFWKWVSFTLCVALWLLSWAAPGRTSDIVSSLAIVPGVLAIFFAAEQARRDAEIR